MAHAKRFCAAPTYWGLIAHEKPAEHEARRVARAHQDAQQEIDGKPITTRRTSPKFPSQACMKAISAIMTELPAPRLALVEHRN